MVAATASASTADTTVGAASCIGDVDSTITIAISSDSTTTIGVANVASSIVVNPVVLGSAARVGFILEVLGSTAKACFVPEYSE